jgi:RNA polymerase sigma-70 factor (ECF subfamily)
VNQSSFDAIVRAHGDALSRLAWGYTDTAADHDDLLQDILVAIWRALPSFRGESSARTFVFRIARNRGVTFVARRRTHEALDRDAAIAAIADPTPGPDEALDRAGELARIAAAVRTLPPTQREAVLLRLEGCSIQEIAAVQNVSENNVSVRLARARERLRELLGGSV